MPEPWVLVWGLLVRLRLMAMLLRVLPLMNGEGLRRMKR